MEEIGATDDEWGSIARLPCDAATESFVGIEMKSQLPAAAVAACALVVVGDVQADDQFDKTKLYLERNVTDGDAEVVIEAKGDDEGLSALTLVAPDGRTLVDFQVPEGKLGIRSVKLESPEPEDDGRVQADFPAGAYGFTGITMDGDRISGSGTLSHRLPPPVSFLLPKDGQEDIPAAGLKVQWKPLKGIEKYVLSLEDAATDLAIEAELPGNASSFEIPNGWMKPDTDYKLAVGSVAPDGNRSFVEIEFETAQTQ
ncbi:hypothetical protein [Candidatus Thiosymbion oneisti]|uniref:hypothetical protein n=1 Tax=Candidatus Thiosymbion oneisti TaxID=589554 RepID=UPI00105F4931|nr:hypothetical protein [Candidatus Thiosymbion oneisti]